MKLSNTLRLSAVCAALTFAAAGAHAQDAQSSASASASVAADAPAPAAPAAPAAAPAVAKLNPIDPVPAGKAQIVFFRPSRYVGMALSFSVREGDKGIVKLTNGSYQVVVTDPGTKEYNISFEAKDTLRMEVEEGETYYVTEGIAMGIIGARPNISPSTEADFQEKKLKLSTAKPTDHTN